MPAKHTNDGRDSSVDYRAEDRGQETPCWVWQRAINKGGYGVIERKGAAFYAHRLAYEQMHGPIPAGLEIDHLCKVRSCVNPAHLEAVTHRENVRRSALAKLTAHQVAEIRACLESGATTRKEIAARFGVSPATIRHIHSGRRWR